MDQESAQGVRYEAHIEQMKNKGKVVPELN
jgi:hypothetical protein